MRCHFLIGSISKSFCFSLVVEARRKIQCLCWRLTFKPLWQIVWWDSNMHSSIQHKRVEHCSKNVKIRTSLHAFLCASYVYVWILASKANFIWRPIPVRMAVPPPQFSSSRFLGCFWNRGGVKHTFTRFHKKGRVMTSFEYSLENRMISVFWQYAFWYRTASVILGFT
jgi:hypothetical protein